LCIAQVILARVVGVAGRVFETPGARLRHRILTMISDALFMPTLRDVSGAVVCGTLRGPYTSMQVRSGRIPTQV